MNYTGYHTANIVTLNGRHSLVVWGGLHHRAPTTRLEVFDLENNIWRAGKCMCGLCYLDYLLIPSVVCTAFTSSLHQVLVLSSFSLVPFHLFWYPPFHFYLHFISLRLVRFIFFFIFHFHFSFFFSEPSQGTEPSRRFGHSAILVKSTDTKEQVRTAVLSTLNTCIWSYISFLLVTLSSHFLKFLMMTLIFIHHYHNRCSLSLVATCRDWR